MARKEAESSTSPKRRDGERGAISNSSALGVSLQTTERNPPPYGAQHPQDALWEGGNEALPPQWQEYKVLGDRIAHEDNELSMTSWLRPLPGVRLDESGQLLVPGCEWHISPLGRSYFVNHNTKTTSWKKPALERPPGSLTPGCVIKGHSKNIRSLACFGTNCDILSASEDGSIRQWKRDGESIGGPWENAGEAVMAMAVSPDEAMFVCGSMDGKLRLWDIAEGGVVGDPWEGHADAAVWCLDWSPDGQEIASGSQDGTIRRWNPNIGQQIVPEIKTRHGRVHAVRYSPQGDKFTSGGEDKMICVWAKAGKLLMKLKGHEETVTMLCWSKDGSHIFSASFDNTIRKWGSTDGEELFVFRGHTRAVRSLCLTPNESHLVSASMDCSVCIWDLETNRLVGDPLLHANELVAVVISPDGKHIASAGLDAKIYVWSLDTALKQTRANDAKLKERTIRDVRIPNKKSSPKYGANFFGTDPNTAPRRATPPSPHTSLPSPLRWFSNLFGSVHVSTSSMHTVDVALAYDEDMALFPIVPPAAARPTRSTDISGSEAGRSAQASQRQTPGTIQGASGAWSEEVSHEVKCCGLFSNRRRCRHPSQP